MNPLLPAFRRQLRARAQPLHPVVAIGHHGLTPSVLHETDIALTAHELIKVRVFSDDREERGALLARICSELDCAPVQQIGKMLVLWRPRPAKATAAQPEAAHRLKSQSNAARPGTPHRRKSKASAAAPEPPPATRRRRASESPRPVPASPTVPARRRGPAGKAPLGVPRAVAPRRRRGTG